MAPNGAAVRLPCELQSQVVAGTPDAATEVEFAIGQAVAHAATGLCFALAEFQNGGLRPETRLVNGTRIAALYTLQQSTLGQIDFPTVARTAGAQVLRGYLDADGFYQRHDPGAGDAMINIAIDEVLEIVGRVTAFERAWAN